MLGKTIRLPSQSCPEVLQPRSSLKAVVAEDTKAPPKPPAPSRFPMCHGFLRKCLPPVACGAALDCGKVLSALHRGYRVLEDLMPQEVPLNRGQSRLEELRRLLVVPTPKNVLFPASRVPAGGWSPAAPGRTCWLITPSRSASHTTAGLP